jgi:hypothetical protein
LLQQLQEVQDSIKTTKHRLSTFPDPISTKNQLHYHAKEAFKLRDHLKNIPESNEEDQIIIDEVDQIRLNAIEAIKTLLGLD